MNNAWAETFEKLHFAIYLIVRTKAYSFPSVEKRIRAITYGTLHAPLAALGYTYTCIQCINWWEKKGKR